MKNLFIFAVIIASSFIGGCESERPMPPEAQRSRTASPAVSAKPSLEEVMCKKLFDNSREDAKILMATASQKAQEWARRNQLKEVEVKVYEKSNNGVLLDECDTTSPPASKQCGPYVGLEYCNWPVGSKEVAVAVLELKHVVRENLTYYGIYTEYTLSCPVDKYNACKSKGYKESSYEIPRSPTYN